MSLDGDTCVRCGRLIKWVKIQKTGKAMPLEARPLIIVTDDGLVVRGRESHFAHCPYAQTFRRIAKAVG